MAEAGVLQEDREPEQTQYAPEIPSKNLPPVPYKSMPKPLPLGRILGPSVILLAASLGSGEYVLWPSISARFGLIVMWAAVLGILTQYFINMEIERYTLATGETAVTGFIRMWKGWAPLFILMTVIPWMWPGWATGAATTLTFAFGGGSVPLITVISLVGIGVALTVSPIVYNFVEKAQMLMVAVILAFLVAAVFLATDLGDWGALVTGFSNVGRIPEGLEIATFLGALAFAGAGGAVNLAQSNWIRDKGLGMGVYAPRVVSPLTGEEVAESATGYFFPQDEENLSRWHRWWRVANHEQFWTFFVLGALGILSLSVLTYSTVYGQDIGGGFDFIRAEGEALSSIVGPWFGLLFWLIGAVVLLSTNLGVLDMVGRVTADILKVTWLRESETWTLSRIYFAVVWAEILFGTLILLVGLDQPHELLVIAAALNGIVMFVYSALLINLNARILPKPIRLRGVRLVAMVWAVLFFGYFSIFLLVDIFNKLFG